MKKRKQLALHLGFKIRQSVEASISLSYKDARKFKIKLGDNLWFCIGVTVWNNIWESLQDNK